MVYTKDDVGCWIDGAFGEEHAAAKLLRMLSDSGQEHIQEDWEDLTDPTSCFSRAEAVDEFCRIATAVLQDQTEAGLVWIWEAGDLILTTEDELD